ncbi:MAG TPA: hypothetical protein VJW76_17110, partial [Verrucomicrobiae bacterium]|nr:hypothetical protein [Verrucomicrobiae bacterium]
SDFVDGDFQAARKSPFAAASSGAAGRPPSREELDTRVGETQHRLMELKRMQEELERERTALEEARRRRSEFQSGREEMLQNLTRGLGLLEEAEFNARRDAEQLAKSLGDLRDALVKVQNIHDETWTQENYNVEITRALTIIDNARMEWNAARLKWTLLNGAPADESDPISGDKPSALSLGSLSFGHLCRLGLALTWPLAIVALGALGLLIFVLFGK